MLSTVCESYCVASLRGYTRAVVYRSSDESCASRNGKVLVLRETNILLQVDWQQQL